MINQAKKQRRVLAVSLFIIMAMLAGCAGAPISTSAPAPTLQATLLVTPSPTPATSEFVPYVNTEGNFTMNLPGDWTIGDPQQIPLGTQYVIGPDPAAGAPANSTIVIADATAFTINQAISQLCGGNCASSPKLENVTLNGMDAWRAVFGAKDAPQLDWYFVEYEGKLIAFSIHDPETLKPLTDVLGSISFGAARDLDPATVPATSAILSYTAKQLKVEVSKIRMLGLAAAEWPNGCLGLPAKDESCTQAIVPGYGGMLDAGGQLFEFRSDESGKVVRLLPAGVLAARQVLAQQLHLDMESVRLVDYEAVEWPDGCLGIKVPGQECAAVITPGFKTTLEAEGGRYVFHADRNGENVQLASAPAVEATDAGIVWKMTMGGCAIAQIGPSQVVFGPCEGALMAGKYAFDKRMKDYQNFLDTYAPFEAQTAAGDIAFKGTGKIEATPPEQRMIAEWAQLVYYEALGGRSGAAYGLVLAWHREGGFAGFCDDLAVYLTGEVYASSCKGQQAQDVGARRLTADELRQVFTWADALKTFEIDNTDDAKADAMTTQLYFGGAGTRDATEEEKQEILNLAAKLYTELSAK